MLYKKIIFAVLTILVLPFTVAAQEDDSLFTLQTGLIVNYIDYDVTKFDILVEKNPVKNTTISYWKVRVYCEDGIFVTLTNLSEDHCGRAITLSNPDLEKFSLFFKSSKDSNSRFSYKLKAYDSEGDWLETQEQSFSWN